MNIGFHNESSARLGCAYDSESPDNDLSINGFFDFSKTKTDSSIGIQEISVDLKEAKTARDIFEISGFDFKAEIKFGLTRGKVSYSKIESVMSQETTTTLILTGKKIFNPDIVTGEVTISSKGLSALNKASKSNDFLPIRKGFGDTIITKAWRGTYICVVYQFRASSKQLAQRINSTISASYASVSGSLNVFSEAKKIDENVTIELSFLHLGTNENEKIIKLIESCSTDIFEVKKIIANYLDNTSKESCSHVRFSGGRISLLPDLLEFQSKFEKADSILRLWGDYNEKAYKYLISLLQIQQNCDIVLNISPDKLKPNAYIDVKQQKEDVEQAINLIFTEFINRDYYKSPSNINEINIIISWSKYILGPIASVDIWKRTDMGSERGGPGCENFEFHNFWQSYYPIIKSDFSKSLKRIRLMLFMQPIASLDKIEIMNLEARNGDFSSYYSSRYRRENVYTWGANNYTSKRNEVEASFAETERERQYQLEVTTDDGLTQIIDVGAYGRSKSEVIIKKDNIVFKQIFNDSQKTQ